MNSYKDKTIKIGVSILMGFSMASISFVHANDAANSETSEQKLTRMAAEKSNRVTRVNDLATYWSAYTREGQQNLFQAFYALSDKQLSAVEAAGDYESVRAIAYGQDTVVVAAAKGLNLQAKLGDIVEDLVYSPVSPCRIVDTRGLTDGTITTDTIRSYNVYGADLTDQGGGAGDAGACLSPRGNIDPSAVHINITAIPRGPEFNNGKGNIQASPKGTAATETVIVKYNLGTNVSNAATVRTARGLGEDIDIRVVGNSADVVIEVLGYYYPVEEIDSNGVAIAHGYINEDGTKNSGTSNVSSIWNDAASRYEITITGETYVFDEFSTAVTLGSPDCTDAIASTNSSGGVMWLSFMDVEGTGTGTTKQCAFMFTTHKNKFPEPNF